MKKHLRNERGLFDIISVLIGLGIVAILAGITVTVMLVVIPWFENKLLSDNFTAVHQAEMTARSDMGRYVGMTNQPHEADLYADGYLTDSMFSTPLCVEVAPDRQSFQVYAQSQSGQPFVYDSVEQTHQEFQGNVPCSFVTAYSGE